MIGRLQGKPHEDPDGALLIDVAGVGYELVAPIGTLGRAAADDTGAVTLFVHTHVREDALELYGFATPDEKSVFRLLISVSKIGPKLALSVLGALRVGELAQLVEGGQSGPLTKIPGVGKKTAERLVLELKGKLGPLARTVVRPAERPVAALHGHATVLQDALVRMGFRQNEAERAIGNMKDLGRPMGELIREALAILSP